MAFKILNRVKMTVASAPGTGSITLGSALQQYQSMSDAGVSDGDTVPYVIEDLSLPGWEIGTGTYTASGTILARTTVLMSSAGGTIKISATANAIVMVSPSQANLQSTDTLTSGTLPVGRGGTGLTSLTAGYIPFGGSSTYSSDSSLFWDNTNKRLGVGTASPISKFTVISGSGSTLAQLNIGYNGSSNYYDADNHFFRNAAQTGQVTIDSAQRITAGALSVSTGSSPNIAALYTGYGGSTNYYDANTHIWRNGSSSETMRISGSSVFIGGTTAPVLGTEALGVYGPLGIKAASLTASSIYANIAGAPNFQTYYAGTSATYIGSIGTDGTNLNISGNAGLNLQVATNTKMTITSGGLVGIGTSSPSSGTKLEVYGNSAGIAQIASTTAGVSQLWALSSDWSSGPSYMGSGLWQYGSTATGTNSGLSNASLGLLAFQNCSAGLIQTNGASPIVFGTIGAERMRITSAGAVGIGTSSPSTTLTVAGATTITSGGLSVAGSASGYSDELRFTSTTSGVEVAISSLAAGAASMNFDHRATSNTAGFKWRNGTGSAVQLMQLDGSGNLGLGVTPSAWGAGWRAFEFGGAGGNALMSGGSASWLTSNCYYNGTNWIYKASYNASYYLQNGGVHSWLTSASGTAGNAISFTQAMTLTAAGYLGIGLTNPGADIHLYRSGANPVLRIERASGAYFDIFATASAGFLSVVTNSDLVFRTNNTDALLISAAGWANVCAATATPAGGSTTAKLIFGTTAGFGIYYGSGAPTVSAAQGSIYLRSDGSSTSTRLYVNTNGSTTWTNVTTAA